MRFRNPDPIDLLGTTRTVRRFAFLPTRISPTLVVWFEFYYKVQSWSEYEYHESGERCFGWRETSRYTEGEP